MKGSENTHSKTLTYKGDFINGEFVKPCQKTGSFTKTSPADLQDRIMEVDFQYDHIDEACLAAQKAFPTWSNWKLEDRIEILNTVKELFEKGSAELAELISRETGKPLWEAKTEAKATVNKFSVTFDHSLKLIIDEKIEKALPTARGVIRYRPRGVLAVIGPFNFPGHLPNGHIVPALVTGNTVVFKPSELTPATGQWLGQCFAKAQLPPGVFNLVQGLGETGKRLVQHKKVDGVLFTGSYETGLKITESTLKDYWKMLALEMGGKNATLIWEDADVEKAIYNTLLGAFLTTGQRCSCTSQIFVHKNLLEEFTEKFYERTQKLKIDHWSKNPFMGSLISETSLKSYLKHQEVALSEGVHEVLQGKPLQKEYEGYYVSPSIYRIQKYDKKSIYQNTELFAPSVGIYEMESIDQAVEMNQASGYGLSMAIFTQTQKIYEECLKKSKVGLLNWNRTTNGASSRMPFGGYGKSGNDRPSGHFAVYYCTTPVASLEDSQPFDPNGVLPGMQWNL